MTAMPTLEELRPVVQRLARGMAGGGFNNEYHEQQIVRMALAGLRVLTPADAEVIRRYVQAEQGEQDNDD